MNNIFKIPAFQRRKAIPKQLKDLELLPLNEQFSKLTMSIVSDDDLRPAMTGNFFDIKKKKIVSTDAHKLTAINMPNQTFDYIKQKYTKELNKELDEADGLIFHTLSQIQKDYNNVIKKAGNNPITISFEEFVKLQEIIDAKYPNYEAVIPKEFTNEIYVDYSKLYWYAKVLLDAKVIDDTTKINTSNANEYQNKKIEYLKDSYVPFLPYTKQIILTYTLDGKQEYIGFNARLLCDLLKFAMEFNGKTFGKVGISGNSRAMVVELENGLNVINDSIGIVMPIMLVSGQFDNTIGDSDFDLSVAMYYDLDTNSIISDKENYPINESIGFMPNKANLSTPNIRVKEEASKVENSSADLIDKKIRGLRIALKVAKQGTEKGDEKLIEKKIKGLEIAKRMKKDDLPFAKGGRVGNSEIEIATLYGKMLNQLGKEKQFNKKFEKKVELDKFSKSNGITIDNNNIISINGIRVAFIDKINQKTGQEKSNWEIKKFNKGGNVDEDISWDITILDVYENEIFEINVRGYFENEEDAIKQAIKDYDIYIEEDGKMYWNGNEIIIYGTKKNYKKGGNVKNGINWYKYDGQYEAEFGNFFLYISPSTQRGYYNFRVTDGYRGDTISESQQEILGLDNAKELAIDIVGDYMKQFKKGGSIGFKGLSNKVASNYEGKKVPQRFQSIYGKTYSQSEAQEVGNKVAGKVYREQQANKMAKGGLIKEFNLREIKSLSIGNQKFLTDDINDKGYIYENGILYDVDYKDEAPHYKKGSSHRMSKIKVNIVNKMAKGGMVEFYDYKGVEIMYEPTYEEYFVNDLVFNSLEKAHKYIDSGEANKTPTYIENLYRRGAMAKGGKVKRDTLNVLNELYDLKNEGVTEVQLNGFYESIGYVIGLQLNDTEIKKVGNNAYITLYENGGSVDEQTYIDLFEDYENIPAEVQMILDEYSESFEDGDYIGMSKAQNELEQIGYTFDFYVDGDAYGLRPMNVKLSQIQGYEDEDEE